MPQPWGRVKLTEVNPHLVCVLCHGYFVDATTMAECPHSFCRSCIVLYLETKSYCPICEVQIHKTKPHLNLKPDKTLQDIVYKLVPGLFHEEMKRRRDFYAKYPNRDLYLGSEARGVGVDRIIYSPEDNISLSLEYYDDEREREEWASARPGTSAEAISQLQQKPTTPNDRDGLKRYLLCPANVSMGLLKKFIRLKYGLSQACTVEILYRRESLPDTYSLMDIAYIYTWKRNGPMRIYYRIHVPTPLKATLPPLTPSSEPIREPTTKKLKSPELLDAVGLRPTPNETRHVPKLELDSIDVKEEDKAPVKEEIKEERPNITTSEDTAVSLLLALRNGVGPKPIPEPVKSPQKTEESVDNPPANTGSADVPKHTPANGGTFKVPQSMTKRFVFNGGKLVAVKSKPSGVKTAKVYEKSKLNGKLNGEASILNDRLTNPLGLVANGQLGSLGGKLPPGSPRPPPNSEKLMKTKYMSSSGLALNWPNPEVTVSQNEPKVPDITPKAPVQTPPSSQHKPNSSPQSKPNGIRKSSASMSNGQPAPHRKEINRLEQIVQNCLKKEASQKAMMEEAKSGKETEVQRDGKQRNTTPTDSAGQGECARATASIRSENVAAEGGRVNTTETRQDKESTPSILKRKLNDPSFNRRMEVQQNGVTVADAKKRRLVTPDVSIELTANPAKEKPQKERKREPSDLSSLTKRFLHDIQRMKKLDTEMKISKIDQMCASTVKIEKVPAPPGQTISIPRPSLGIGDKSKPIDGNDFNSEDDQLFIDIRNKCEALKRKNLEPASIAIERVTEDTTTKSNLSHSSPSKLNELTVTSSTETSPKLSGTHKKLPRLIEINAPPRPKLPTIVSDPKLKTGLKMTTVRKEVPIGKERPLVRKDCTGALDLSSGMSPPGVPKSGNKSPFQRPPSTDKGPVPSSLSPLMAMASFPSPDANRSSPIRIPSLKPKTSPTSRPSSLSSSSPSPPAEPRSNDLTNTYQQLYRHQMELQSRFLASQVNNNWSRDALSAKKFEEWMRNVMNLPHHPLMFPSQLSPEASRK